MRHLTPDETLNLLRAARQHGAREHLLFLLCYVKGLRVSEAVNIQLSDISSGNLDVRRLKGSLHTVQPLSSHLNSLLDERKALQSWLKERGDHPSIFLFTSRAGSRISRQQAFRLFQDIAMRAGISRERRHPHILKHSICQHLVESGVNLPYIRQQVGHSDPKSTMRYMDIHDRKASEVTATALGAIFQ